MNAQVQFIDFEGRSDGGSLLQILSQLRPRRIVLVRGTPDNIDIVSKHCVQSIGARVFTPKKGDIVDATTETHIYQVRLTEALISQLFFQKGKDAEIAWMDSGVVVRQKQIAAIGAASDMEVDQEEPTEGNFNFFFFIYYSDVRFNDQTTSTQTYSIFTVIEEDQKLLTLAPLDEEDIPPHNSVFVNELKLSDFKQILQKHNINSEFSGGVLWCSNGTLALKRVNFHLSKLKKINFFFCCREK